MKLFRVLIPAYKAFSIANKGRTFRQRVHALVFPSAYGGELHNLYDSFIVVWVVISVLAVILESVHSIHYLLNMEFLILDAIAVSIFTFEYCLRMYCCVEEPVYKKAFAGRLKMAKSTSSIIDLLAIAPFFLEVFLHHLIDLRFMRVFRLLRLLKLTRYTGATQSHHYHMGNLLVNMAMNICARRWRHPRRSGHEHFLEQVNFITILKSRLYGYQHFLEQVNLAERLNSSDFGISTGLIIKIIGKIANGIV